MCIIKISCKRSIEKNGDIATYETNKSHISKKVYRKNFFNFFQK